MREPHLSYHGSLISHSFGKQERCQEVGWQHGAQTTEPKMRGKTHLYKATKFSINRKIMPEKKNATIKGLVKGGKAANHKTF